MTPEWPNTGVPPKLVNRSDYYLPEEHADTGGSQKARYWRRLKKFAACLCAWTDKMKPEDRPAGLVAALFAAKEEVVTLALATKAANLAASAAAEGPWT
jgi:hypothetical protein